MKVIKVTAVVAAMLGLAGCASFSPDGGMSLVQDVAHAELGKRVAATRTPEEAEASSAEVKALLARPLTADTAVQIALLNNRGLQAEYNALGLAEAAKVQGSLPPNPTLVVERMSSSLELEIEKRIVANILALVTLPARAAIAEDRFRQAQLRAVGETLRVAAEARRSFYRAVAQRQLTSVLAQAKDSAETASKLAAQLGRSGASSPLDQAREHVFYAEITAQLASARQRATSERERLARVMGLWGADLDFRLPGALPPLPARPLQLANIEVEAVRRRVDLQMARIEVEALNKTLGLTGATRFVNLLEVAGVDRKAIERESGHVQRADGFELELQVPIFDLGEVRVRQAGETYAQAVNRLMEKAVNVRSEARDAYRVYRSAYDIAAHYRREVMPLRRIIGEQTLLRYNAMQIDVFALLAETRQRINAQSQSIEAQRDFWLGATNLTTAVVGGGAAGDAGADARTAAVAGGEAGGH